MAYVRVVVVDEDGNPQKGVTVVAYSLANFPDIAAREMTDDAGSATFTVSGPVFFDAFNRRGVSMRDRNYPGRIQIQIVSFGNLMNVDYVVDVNGFGTHTSLFGTGGALEDSVNDQADRVIWICTTHTETQTSSVNLAGLANGQQITVMSGGPYRPTITADMNSPLFTQPTANTGTKWRYIFKGINWSAASGKTPTIFRPNAGISATPIEFVDCNFEGAGAWQYGIDLTGAGSATSNGLVFDNCRGTLVAFAKLSSGGAATGPMVIRDCVMAISKFMDRTNSTDVEAGDAYLITDNVLTVTGSSPYSQTYFTGNMRVVITGNTIVYSGTSALFGFGTTATSSINDITMSGNNTYNSAGGSAVRFTAGAGTAKNVNITGNAFRGPGSGVAIDNAGGFTLDGINAFQPNGFRDWTTYIDTGMTTTFPGGLAVTGTPSIFAPTLEVEGNPDSLSNRMVVLDSTGAAGNLLEFQRSGVRKAVLGLWATSAPAPFGANDFVFGVDDGTLRYIAAFQNDGTKFTLFPTTGDNRVVINGTEDNIIVSGTTYASRLSVHDEDGTAVEMLGLHKHNATAGAPATLFFARSRGTEGAETVVASGDHIGRINFVAFDGTDYVHAAQIIATVSATPGSNDMPGTLTFYTTPDGSTIPTARMEIHHDGGIHLANYMNVGSLAAPNNITDGDLTTLRLIVGDNTALSADTGQFVRIVGTTTDTGPGADILITMQPTIAPASNSTAEVRSLFFTSLISAPTGVTQNAIIGYWGENRMRSDGALTSLTGWVLQALVYDSSSPATPGTITTLRGIDLRLFARPSGTSTGSVTNATGIDFTNRITADAITITTLKDINLPDEAQGTLTTHVGIDMAKYTRATTNIEFRSAGKMVYTPTAQTLAAAGNTIVSTARTVDLGNSTGASLTMTSTPTIAAGVSDGQMLRLTNVDTADNIVLQDESVAAGTALRLTGAANLTLGPRDSVDFRWKASTSEWWACASANL